MKDPHFSDLPKFDMFATCQTCGTKKRLHVSSKANFQRNMKRKYKWVKSHGEWLCQRCSGHTRINETIRGSMAEWWTCKRKRAYLVIDLAIEEAEAAKERTQKTMVAYRCRYCNKYHIGHESKNCNNVIYKARYTVTEVETKIDLDHYEGIATNLLELLNNEEQFDEIESIVVRFKIAVSDGLRSTLEIDTAGGAEEHDG